MFRFITQKTSLFIRNIAKRNMGTKEHSYGSNSIVWIDMEMTGLKVETDEILEVACIVTDENLDILAKCSTFVLHQPDEILNNMNEWCMEHHTKTGLIEDSRKSSLTLEQVQQELYKFLEKNVPKGKCPLAGNSVYMDRLFLRKYMPQVNDYLHYRIIDVSTLKELCRRWDIDSYNKAPKKLLVHRAEDDIIESIHELKYYRSLWKNCNCSK